MRDWQIVEIFVFPHDNKFYSFIVRRAFLWLKKLTCSKLWLYLTYLYIGLLFNDIQQSSTLWLSQAIDTDKYLEINATFHLRLYVKVCSCCIKKTFRYYNPLQSRIMMRGQRYIEIVHCFPIWSNKYIRLGHN